ncbi:TPA: hypothetical protein ACFRGX_002154, partial [Neisseria meningitidis]
RFEAGEFDVGQAHDNVSNRKRRRILTEIRLSVERKASIKSDCFFIFQRPSEKFVKKKQPSYRTH